MREVYEGLTTEKSCVFGLVRVGACVKFRSGKWKKSSLLAFPGSKTGGGGCREVGPQRGRSSLK